jgi:hypothetical protein
VAFVIQGRGDELGDLVRLSFSGCIGNQKIHVCPHLLPFDGVTLAHGSFVFRPQFHVFFRTGLRQIDLFLLVAPTTVVSGEAAPQHVEGA